MKKKNRTHSHKVTINDQRRVNKMASDLGSKPVSKKVVHNVFETYYKNQVKALYRAVLGE